MTSNLFEKSNHFPNTPPKKKVLLGIFQDLNQEPSVKLSSHVSVSAGGIKDG